MKLYVILIFLTGSCISYKLDFDKSESKGFDQFLVDDRKPEHSSPKRLQYEEITIQKLPYSYAKPNQRVFGGEVITPNKYPFLAGIILTEGDGKKFWCGGSIINNKYILTAAHCLDEAINATIILGAHDRSNPAEATRLTQTVSQRNFIIHRSWDEETFRNDIALIKLNIIINFSSIPSPAIQPILLANNTYAAIDGVLAGIPGWGYFNTSNILSQFPLYTEDVLIPNAICRETYGSLVRSTNVCLNGNSGKTACPGDAGGPLFILNNGVFIQVGIASFGSDLGCDKWFPTVFTRVSKYFAWIQRNAD